MTDFNVSSTRSRTGNPDFQSDNQAGEGEGVAEGGDSYHGELDISQSELQLAKMRMGDMQKPQVFFL